jgi:hypothetical protein
MNSGFDERRAFQRLVAGGKVQINAGNGLPPFVQASLENIGFNGFAVRMQRGLLPESVVEFALYSPLLEQPILGKAKVKYVRLPKLFRPFVAGLEFIDVEKDLVRRALEKGLRSAKEKEFTAQRQKRLRMFFVFASLLIFLFLFVLSAARKHWVSLEGKQQYYENYQKAEQPLLKP